MTLTRAQKYLRQGRLCRKIITIKRSSRAEYDGAPT